MHAVAFKYCQTFCIIRVFQNVMTDESAPDASEVIFNLNLFDVFQIRSISIIHFRLGCKQVQEAGGGVFQNQGSLSSSQKAPS